MARVGVLATIEPFHGARRTGGPPKPLTPCWRYQRP